MGYRLWASLLVVYLRVSTLQALVDEVRSLAIGDNYVKALRTAKLLSITVLGVHRSVHKDLCSVEG